MITYLSPTSFALYKKDKENFYLRYLSGIDIPREPQNQPMAIGASFDAYVKSYLFERLFGRTEEKYLFENLFEAQVEEHNRDWALPNGKYVFDQYLASGALGDLFTEISRGSEPRFEFKIGGAVSGYREGISSKIENVPLSGKPDCSFVTEDGYHVILDFKVNGFLSKYNVSPAKGYIKLRAMNMNYGGHKDAFYGKVGNMTINIGDTLDQVKEDWAEQLSIYAWMCGENVGGEFICGIHQIVCNGSEGGKKLPKIKVAEHMNKVSEKFQKKLFLELVDAWEIIKSDWFFRDLSKEDSLKRCEMLKNMYQNEDRDPWLESILR